ncbi:hypothetical protein CDL15_Pgr008870 [Punica granatum]|nr:hypothetical protein CDL15_Pgr008870 [Punica granatum]
MELPPFRPTGTSFLKTCFNGLNALSGIGIITLPYTLSQAGWLGLALLSTMAAVTCYTGLLLQRCIESDQLSKTYPEVGFSAFDRKGLVIISVFMYLELYLVPTGFLIMEGDNLHKLFPDVGFQLGTHEIGGRQFFIVMAGLVVLPSMWLKDLSKLSCVSACGVVSSLVVMGSIFWVGEFDGVGFRGKGTVLFDLSGVPKALSLYAFCYGAHPVFPTLYSSMKDKSKFSKVLFISFGLSTLSYISVAGMGYSMFGRDTLSQVTLNLPGGKISSKIAIYTAMAGPIAKYALIITPIAEAIEGSLPSPYNNRPTCILLRTLLLISTVIVALLFPFFGPLMALVGAALNVTVSILFPCACYLKISKAYQRWRLETVVIFGIIVFGFSIGVLGTYSSLKGIVKHAN